MNEMDSQTIRHIAIVMERRESLHLRFPVKLISPVLANLLEELETDSIFPSGAGYLVKPAGSTQPVSKVVHRPLREGYRKRFQGHRYCPILESLPSDLLRGTLIAWFDVWVRGKSSVKGFLSTITRAPWQWAQKTASLGSHRVEI